VWYMLEIVLGSMAIEMSVLHQGKLVECGTGLLHGHLEHLVNGHLGLVLGSGCLHG
jgi:hypothetical protein